MVSVTDYEAHLNRAIDELQTDLEVARTLSAYQVLLLVLSKPTICYRRIHRLQIAWSRCRTLGNDIVFAHGIGLNSLVRVSRDLASAAHLATMPRNSSSARI